MPNVFRCPACGRDLEARDAALSVAGSCRFCGAQIVSPSAPGAEATLIGRGPVTWQPGSNGVSQPTGRPDPGEILSEAWDLLKVHWAILLAAMLVVSLISAAIIMPFEFGWIFWMTSHASNPIAMQRQMAREMWAFYPVMLILGAIMAPISAGPIYLAHSIIVNGNADFSVVFRGLRHFKALFVYGLGLQLLGALPSFIFMPFQMTPTPTPSPWMILASVVAFAFMMFVYLTLGLARMEIIDRGVDAITAFKASWEFTKGHRWMILATGIVLVIAYMAGAILCCVGIFFTMGFIPLGEVLIYRHLRGLQGTPDA